jgi:hypothetical protein
MRIRPGTELVDLKPSSRTQPLCKPDSGFFFYKAEPQRNFRYFCKTLMICVKGRRDAGFRVHQPYPARSEYELERKTWSNARQHRNLSTGLFVSHRNCA